METGIEDIEGLVRNLNIDAPQDRGQEPLPSTCSHLVSLQDAIHMLIQSTNTVTSQAQSVKSLADDATSSGNLPIAEVCSLREGIKQLTNITFNLQSTVDALNEATERSVIIRLRSLGGRSASTVFEILSHFDEQIKGIVREVLDNTRNREVLWKVAEECYKQVISPSGNLHADDYFVPLEEAGLGWPYDPDFEAEEYYEHENRLDVDKNYALAFQKQVEHRSEARRKDRQRWPEFWIRVLNNSPAGPTLFYPPASFDTKSLNFDAVPQYLFRTFDKASSGRNDEGVIASMASIIGSHESSRTDILTLERQRATELLYKHLNKSCFGGEESDNLMSWTSSLVFAIQYAVWRLRVRRCRPSDIKICAVDTRNFPQGQFAQDVWLIEAYHATAKRLGNESIRKFFDFRLEKEDFYNVSLEHLIQAGLFQLYPEFEDAGGSKEWTRRVREMRQNWSAEQGTTDREIQLALNVGRNCFPQFESTDIASIFLTFKNRICSRVNPTDHFFKKRPKWADKPDEVRRYWIAYGAINSYNKLPHTWINHLLQQHYNTLREIFDQNHIAQAPQQV